MPLASCHFRGAPRARLGRETRRRTAAAALTIAFALGATSACAATGIEGVWFDDTGKGAVEITRCGRKLCGHIVWLRNPLDSNGRPQIDDLNPNVRRRNQPICGLKVIGQLELQGDGSWDRGWIYDPKQGKSFDVMLTLKSPTRLVVTGYLGIKFLSETFVWRRAPADLPRCTANSR